MTTQQPPTACWGMVGAQAIVEVTFEPDMNNTLTPLITRWIGTIDAAPRPFAAQTWDDVHTIALNWGIVNPAGAVVKLSFEMLDYGLQDHFGLLYNPWDPINVPPC